MEAAHCALQAKLPHLPVLGDYAPAERQPFHLDHVIAGVLPEVTLPAGEVDHLYAGRRSSVFRAGEECPQTLQPLAELQPRGTLWTQKHGKDWTVEAFLVSEDGVGLDVAKDGARGPPYRRPRLADAPLSVLRGKRLEAEDFDRLVIDDQPRDLLTWPGDPEGTKK